MEKGGVEKFCADMTEQMPESVWHRDDAPAPWRRVLFGK